MSDTTNAVAACEWCGLIHSTKCPLVKALEYFPDGTLKRVEFHDPVPPNGPYVYGPAGTQIPVRPQQYWQQVFPPDTPASQG